MDQSELDARIQVYYAEQFEEAERLTTRSAQGRLEPERTQELVAARVPAGSRILDVGGATGVHAALLAAAGHAVTLLDPVPAQVEAARRHGGFEAYVGDARDLPCPDASYDAALLLGPLYHLAARTDRLRALAEARRVVRPGGWVFAAAIPRLARLVTMGLAETDRPTAADLGALLGHGAPTGWGRFPGAHFHTAAELEDELAAAGLVEVEVCALEGPDGLALERVAGVDEEVHQAALRVVRAVGHLPGVRDLSNHLLATARVAARTPGTTQMSEDGTSVAGSPSAAAASWGT